MPIPRWAYDIEAVPGKHRKRTQTLYFVLRDDHKKFGPFLTKEHAESVIERFRAWAMQPWPRSH